MQTMKKKTDYEAPLMRVFEMHAFQHILDGSVMIRGNVTVEDADEDEGEW